MGHLRLVEFVVHGQRRQWELVVLGARCGGLVCGDSRARKSAFDPENNAYVVKNNGGLAKMVVQHKRS